jgi:hypothetical protein
MWEPDAYDLQRREEEAEAAEAKCPGWLVVYGWHSRRFWGYGAIDGVAVEAKSAPELLGRIREAEIRQRSIQTNLGKPRYETRPPMRPYVT